MSVGFVLQLPSRNIPFQFSIDPKGEVHVRGHNIMLGYWKEPEKTAECIDRAGWYNTGDLGSMDENGFLKIHGRTKELIIVGGENVHPLEVEELLHTHPDIANVYVVGVPDARKGEAICAWVELANPKAKVTEEDLKKFCQDRVRISIISMITISHELCLADHVFQSPHIFHVRQGISDDLHWKGAKIQNA